MKLTFHGAAGGVTGSAYHVQTEHAGVLVDFGMFQAVKHVEELNRLPRGLSPAQLQAVLLTHAHLDHTGRLPLLVQHGFEVPVYCTPATVDVASLILRDSAKVQAQDIERTNRKRQQAGLPPVAALYGLAEVDAILGRLAPIPYDRLVPVAPGISARFVEAGHMLGSASIQLLVQEAGRERILVFSGDLGPKGAPLLKDPVGFQQAHLVVLESTYGDRDHKPLDQTVAEFQAIVREAVERRGKILVPTFAVGRAQLLLYLLALMFRNQVVPKFPIYVDSPMAVEATRIYNEHAALFDDDFQALRQERPLSDDMDTVHHTSTPEESRALNDLAGPCMILAGSGMCTAGRILHHFKQNLSRPETSVIIVGFQTEGSLGRLLVEGRKQVSIFGEKIVVRARIHTLGGFSAHAGQSDLLRWLEPLVSTKPRLVLTHGENKARDALAARLSQRFQLAAERPTLGQSITL